MTVWSKRASEPMYIDKQRAIPWNLQIHWHPFILLKQNYLKHLKAIPASSTNSLSSRRFWYVNWKASFKSWIRAQTSPLASSDRCPMLPPLFFPHWPATGQVCVCRVAFCKSALASQSQPHSHLWTKKSPEPWTRQSCRTAWWLSYPKQTCDSIQVHILWI